jgi:hypothetical protein
MRSWKGLAVLIEHAHQPPALGVVGRVDDRESAAETAEQAVERILVGVVRRESLDDLRG